MANSETFQLYTKLTSSSWLQLKDWVIKIICRAAMMQSYKENYTEEFKLSHSKSPLRSRTNIFPFLRTNTIEKRRQRTQTCSTILCLIMVLRSRTFIATLSPVSVFWANFTFAKVPSPIVLPTSYLPTFLTTISAVNLLRFRQVKILISRTRSQHLQSAFWSSFLGRNDGRKIHKPKISKLVI